jgi:D-glycero-D-manno-heptose 1,7-bisphosphate phosphatase
MPHKAVFLDRDGVIVADGHLLHKPEDLRILPGAAEAIAGLKHAGYVVVVVTNQTVVARGLATETEIEALHTHIQTELLKTDPRAHIDAFYFCPHHPNADVSAYRQNCECRKPRPGMLLQAAQDLQIDLQRSYMIGDRLSDITAGQAAGCFTILLETGMHTAAPILSDVPSDAVPDARCANLLDAVTHYFGEKD